MHELVRAVAELELQLQDRYALSLNEAMVLCCLGSDTLTASNISENTGLLPSNMSKILRSVEVKGLVTRSLGETDRRQMRFTLTEQGRERLQKIRAEEIEIPEFIKPLF